MGIRYADHVTPLYPQKLALTSPTGGGRSVGIVRSRTKTTEFNHYSVLYVLCIVVVINNIKNLVFVMKMQLTFLKYKMSYEKYCLN